MSKLDEMMKIKHKDSYYKYKNTNQTIISVLENASRRSSYYGGVMKNSSTYQYEQNHFVREVMKKIESISELDNSPNHLLSRNYHEK